MKIYISVSRTADWFNQLAPAKQKEYLAKHPKSTLQPVFMHTPKYHIKRVTKMVKRNVLKNLHKYRKGIQGLASFRTGKPMSKEQRQGLSKLMVLVAGTFIVAAAFTPLAGAALDLGETYLRHKAGISESATQADDNLDWLIADFSKFMARQKLDKWGTPNADKHQ